MSRTEVYPWSLLTEVGDYFAVPDTVKPYSYMSQLIAQRNYRAGKGLKLTTVKTTYGTIVLVAQIGDELPPFEFRTPEGILAVTSRENVKRSQDHNTPLGERPTRPVRSQREIVAAMTTDMKIANLPWWYDGKGTLVFNPKVATPEDLDRWYNKQKMPGPDDPYPDYYNLDEYMQIKPSASGQSGVDVDDEEFFEVLEEDGASHINEE